MRGRLRWCSPRHAWGPPDGLRPARLTVGIISAGRVGTALGVALERAEHVVVACSAISRASRQRAERRLPDTQVLPVQDVAAHAELLLLTVPDAELAGVVAGLATTGSVRPGTIVVHTSGANGVGVLAPLTELRLHPAGHPPGDDVHRIRRGHRPAVRCVLRHHRGRRRRVTPSPSRWCSRSAGSRSACARRPDRSITPPSPTRGNHVVTVLLDAVRGVARRAAGTGTARPGGRRRRSRRHRRAGDRSAGPRVAGERAAAWPGRTHRSGRPRRRRRRRRAISARSSDVDPELAQAYRANSLRTAQRAHAPDDVFAVLAEPSNAGGSP